MCQLQPPTRRIMRLTCRGARADVDARWTGLAPLCTVLNEEMVPTLRGLAPRLHSLMRLDLDWGLEDLGGFGDALAALPNPLALTRLSFGRANADELSDCDIAQRLAAGLARLRGLRRLTLQWGMTSASLYPWRTELHLSMHARTAAALGTLRRLPALAELEIDLTFLGESGAGMMKQLRRFPGGAGLLPWSQLEGLALVNDGVALAPLLMQPPVAQQLTRLRALSASVKRCEVAQLFAVSLAPLWRMPWLSQLTRLCLTGIDEDRRYCRAFFEALPAAGWPAPSRGPPLLPQVQDLCVAGRELYSGMAMDTPDGLERLLGACNLGTLRRLELQGFRDVRRGVAGHAARLTALTELRFTPGLPNSTWSPCPGADAAAHAQQLATFLASRR